MTQVHPDIQTTDTFNTWRQATNVLLGFTQFVVTVDYEDQSNAFTAEINSGYSIDMSQAIDMTLPANPGAANREIHIFRRTGSWETNPLTVLRNGQTIENLAEDLVIDSDLIRFVRLKWVTEGTWRVLGA